MNRFTDWDEEENNTPLHKAKDGGKGIWWFIYIGWIVLIIVSIYTCNGGKL